MVKRLTILFFAALFLLLIPLSWSAPLRDTAVRALKPLERYLIHHNTGLVNSLKSIRQIPSLRDDKADLQKQVIDLEEQVSTKETLERENETLKKEAGVTGVTKGLNKVLAHVLIQGSDPLDRTLVIDVGSDQGIQVGQAAISQGSLIGKVISVRQHSAVVRSVLSQESRIQIWIAQNREKGLLIGDGNSVYISDITQGVTINKNSLVETSGLGGSLPQGIIVGTIKDTLSKQSELSQSFSIQLAQDPLQVESLFIVLTDTQ